MGKSIGLNSLPNGVYKLNEKYCIGISGIRASSSDAG
jgi:hypothetical protein